jgi:hypothetical protein
MVTQGLRVARMASDGYPGFARRTDGQLSSPGAYAYHGRTARRYAPRPGGAAAFAAFNFAQTDALSARGAWEPALNY